MRPSQLVFDAGAALVVLVGITGLSVYKPWGRTPHGRRTRENRPAGEGLPAGIKGLLVLVGLAGAIIAVLRLTGHPPMSHGQ